MRTLPRTSLVAAVSLVLAAGCTNSADPEPPEPSPEPTEEPTGENDPTDEPTQEPEPEPEAAVTVTRELLSFEVEVGVHAVEVEGDLAALVVDYTVPEEQMEDFESRLGSFRLGQNLNGARVGTQSFAGGLRLLDLAERTVHRAPIDSPRIASDFLTEDGAMRSISLHPAPQSESVDVLIPALGYVADVPVVPAEELFDEVSAAIEPPGDPAVFPLSTRTISYDDSSEIEEEGDEVTVTLTSDVLFGPDEHELGGDSGAVLERAVQEIQSSSDGGEIQVIGHTDNVPTDAYADNQELSERRAASVGGELEDLLGGDYQVRTEGRGESEPRASNSSEEGRAQNRRVEIQFEGRRVIVGEDADEELGDDELELPEASGNDAVEFEGWEVSAESVVRREGALVGTLRIEMIDGDSALPFHSVYNVDPGQDGYFHPGRGYGAVTQGFGASRLALRTAEEWVMPMDYAVEEQDEDEGSEGQVARHLASEEAPYPEAEEAGEVRLITVIWPDTGQDEVDVEAFGRFRLLDVPVSESAEED